jgi:hypothetical protein
MKNSLNFSGWDFSTAWTIRADSTYPGLRSIDNAPFAFADTFSTNRTFALALLLLNDCDIETACNNLTLRVTSISRGTSDGISTLIFSDTIANGTVAIVNYRVGEIRATDTLWGNIATAIITLDTTVTTGVQASDIVPALFELKQNYPNPFNPSTTILFNLASKSQVTLKIYDILGREVTFLVNNETMSAGKYSKQWNAANMPSGIYFYRLQAGNFVQTKKLVLLK